MDKIQELHYNEIGAGYIPEESKKVAAIHATITEDMMGRFAEWVGREQWKLLPSGMWLRNERKATSYKNKFVQKSTSELIQLFKETL